jgi:hypothetical protein
MKYPIIVSLVAILASISVQALPVRVAPAATDNVSRPRRATLLEADSNRAKQIRIPYQRSLNETSYHVREKRTIMSLVMSE